MLVNKASDLEKLTQVDAIWTGIQDVLRPEGVDFLIYLTVDHAMQNPFLLTNIPEIYAQAPPENDPFLSHCCDSYAISQTGGSYLEQHGYLPQEAKDFIDQAKATGFKTGLGIPMRLQGSPRFGGFNIGTRMDTAEFEAKIWPRAEEFRLLCLLVHRRIEELSTPEHTPQTQEFRNLLIAPEEDGLPELSPREREVAYLVAQGMSRKECARLCGISPHTVSEYLKSSYRKLGVNNRVALAQKFFGHAAQ